MTEKVFCVEVIFNLTDVTVKTTHAWHSHLKHPVALILYGALTGDMKTGELFLWTKGQKQIHQNTNGKITTPY